MIELRHLRTLRALDEHGSLVRAGEALHLSQSALSHQLRDLEHRLGAQVLARDRRPSRWTAVGRRLLALAHAVLAEVETAQRDIAQLAGGRSGRLHIGLECHSCFEWLMPAMDAYRLHWPQVEMDLSLAHTFHPLPALARGELDLVVTSDAEPLPEVVYTPLFGYQAVLVMAVDHPLARRRWIAPTDLAQETLITYPVERARLDAYRAFLDPAGVEPRATRTAELTPVILQLVASRRGVALLPSWTLTGREDLAARPLGADGLWGVLYAARRERDAGLAYVEDFVQTARRVAHEVLPDIRPAAPTPRSADPVCPAALPDDA